MSNKFKIISKKICAKKYLFHSTSLSIDVVDPKFCKKVDGSYEYEKPTIHAFDKITNEYCFEPIGDYRKILNSGISWAHHKLKLKDRILFLGTKLKGYIYVLDGKDFYKIVRQDFECDKWETSTEWICYNKIKPIEKIEIEKAIDVENIPEYEYLGQKYVGLIKPEKYLKLATDKKVTQAIKDKINENFKPWSSKEIEKYLF